MSFKKKKDFCGHKNQLHCILKQNNVILMIAFNTHIYLMYYLLIFPLKWDPLILDGLLKTSRFRKTLFPDKGNVNARVVSILHMQIKTHSHQLYPRLCVDLDERSSAVEVNRAAWVTFSVLLVWQVQIRRIHPHNKCDQMSLSFSSTVSLKHNCGHFNHTAEER